MIGVQMYSYISFFNLRMDLSLAWILLIKWESMMDVDYILKNPIIYSEFASIYSRAISTAIQARNRMLRVVQADGGHSELLRTPGLYKELNSLNPTMTVFSHHRHFFNIPIIDPQWWIHYYVSYSGLRMVLQVSLLWILVLQFMMATLDSTAPQYNMFN
ncbi:hypothetical protein BU15DRAFT_64195 [Melanogaster broomeanus]|nr:hypothetical protein BU15DRAFT_64195 [Melanogaster broomeanus]